MSSIYFELETPNVPEQSSIVELIERRNKEKYSPVTRIHGLKFIVVGEDEFRIVVSDKPGVCGGFSYSKFSMNNYDHIKIIEYFLGRPKVDRPEMEVLTVYFETYNDSIFKILDSVLNQVRPDKLVLKGSIKDDQIDVGILYNKIFYSKCKWLDISEFEGIVFHKTIFSSRLKDMVFLKSISVTLIHELFIPFVEGVKDKVFETVEIKSPYVYQTSEELLIQTIHAKNLKLSGFSNVFGDNFVCKEDTKWYESLEIDSYDNLEDHMKNFSEYMRHMGPTNKLALTNCKLRANQISHIIGDIMNPGDLGVRGPKPLLIGKNFELDISNNCGGASAISSVINLIEYVSKEFSEHKFTINVENNKAGHNDPVWDDVDKCLFKYDSVVEMKGYRSNQFLSKKELDKMQTFWNANREWLLDNKQNPKPRRVINGKIIMMSDRQMKLMFGNIGL